MIKQLLVCLTLFFTFSTCLGNPRANADSDAQYLGDLIRPSSLRGPFQPSYSAGNRANYGFGGGASYNHYHYGGNVAGGNNQQYYAEYYQHSTVDCFPLQYFLHSGNGYSLLLHQIHS